MGGWLSTSFASSIEKNSLTLSTTKQGVPGFMNGKSLTLHANPGDTVGSVVERFNIYRGPTHQITHLTKNGATLLFSEIVQGDMKAFF